MAPDLLRRMNRFGDRFSLEQQAFPDLIENGYRLTGYVSDVEMFIDIGTPEDYQRAKVWIPASIRTRQKPKGIAL